MSRSKEKEIKKLAASSGYKLLSQRASKDLKRKRDSDDEDDESEKEEEAKKSVFAKYTKRLRRLRRKGLSDEAYDIEEINALEMLILDLIPIAEENYRKFPIHTAASAVNHYVATLSSLQADRRALQDLTARADRVTNIFDQSFNNFTLALVTSVQKLQADIAEKGSSKDTGDLFKEFLRSLGKELTNIKTKNNESVLQLMAAPKK